MWCNVVHCQTRAALAHALKDGVEATYEVACQAQRQHDAAAKTVRDYWQQKPIPEAVGNSNRERQRTSTQVIGMIFVKTQHGDHGDHGYRAALTWMDPGARYVVLWCCGVVLMLVCSRCTV